MMLLLFDLLFQYSLPLEVFNQTLHVPQFTIQFDFLVAQPIELSAKVSNVSLKHAIDVGARDGLVLQEAPFGLQHLVLLLQETNLCRNSFSHMLLLKSSPIICYSRK